MTEHAEGLPGRAYRLPSRIDTLVAACARRAQQDGDEALAAVLVRARLEIEEAVHYDALDGGQTGHAVRLLCEERDLGLAEQRGARLETELRDRMNAIVHVPGEYISEVRLVLDLDRIPRDWRLQTGLIPSASQLAQASADSSRRIWGDSPLRVFLSHRAEFKVETKQLKDELARYGIAAFVAHEDIEPTLSWQEEIERALFSAHALVALLSSGFGASCWTQQEVGVALGRCIPVLSVKLGEDPAGFVGRYQAIPGQMTDGMATMGRDLAQRFLQERALTSAAAQALVGSWESVRAYKDAVRLASTLKYLPEISDDHLMRMVAAFKANDQLHGSAVAKEEFVRFYKRVRPQAQAVKS